MDDAEASDELAGQPAGTFLVRFSTPGNYAISVCTQERRVRHVKVAVESDLAHMRVCADGSSAEEHALST